MNALKGAGFEPYIEKCRVWDCEFLFLIANFQDEDWYGIRGVQRKTGCSEESARDYWNSWNPDLRKLVQPGNVVIDCGAHHGFISIIFAKYVGGNGSVIAIEADPANAELLRRNVELNEIANIRVLNKIVGDESGRRLSVRSERVWYGGSPAVETVQLDDFFAYKPDVIKVDVEGYEVRVLRGAPRILSRVRPRFEIELHLLEVDMRQYGDYPSELAEILFDNGYKIFYRGQELNQDFFRVDLKITGCVYAYPNEYR